MKAAEINHTTWIYLFPGTYIFSSLAVLCNKYLMSDLNYAIKSKDMNQTLFAVPK
jgi:hypothetical protein